jgi:hypothetical protein
LPPVGPLALGGSGGREPRHLPPVPVDEPPQTPAVPPAVGPARVLQGLPGRLACGVKGAREREGGGDREMKARDESEREGSGLRERGERGERRECVSE